MTPSGTNKVAWCRNIKSQLWETFGIAVRIVVGQDVGEAEVSTPIAGHDMWSVVGPMVGSQVGPLVGLLVVAINLKFVTSNMQNRDQCESNHSKQTTTTEPYKTPWKRDKLSKLAAETVENKPRNWPLTFD